MTVRLEVIPVEPDAMDAIQIFVHGEVEEPATVKITGDGDLFKIGRSTVFTQGVMPAGTGPSAFELEVTGSPGESFVLTVYEYGEEDSQYHYETEPVYYHDDGDNLYPTGDAIIEAIQDAYPDADVIVHTHSDGVRTVLLGGVTTGTPMVLLADTGVTVTQVEATAGPYQWGPVVLPAGDYTIDVVDDEDESILDGDPVELEVS